MRSLIQIMYELLLHSALPYMPGILYIQTMYELLLPSVLPYMPGIPAAPWRGPLLPGVSPGTWSHQEGRTRQERSIPTALAQGMQPHAGRAQACQDCGPGMPHCTRLYSALHISVHGCSPTAFRTILSALSGGLKWRRFHRAQKGIQNWRQNCRMSVVPIVGWLYDSATVWTGEIWSTTVIPK